MDTFIQQDMFNNTEIDLLKEEIKVVRQRTDNIRRGLFARHNELFKLYQMQNEELDKLKSYIYSHDLAKSA